MASRTLKVEIIGDTSRLSRAFKGAGSDVSKLEGRVKSAGHHFATMGKLAGSAGLALGAGLAVEAGRAVVAFEETRKVGAQTNAVLKSTGGAAKVSAAAVADLATAISNKTGIDDEAIQSTENMLLTFTKLRNETGKGNDIFTQATKIATDMSVALGQDGTKSAIQLGKALNDPIKGVTALSRVGVTFTQGQKDQIKTLESTGHHLAAQKIILRELNKEFKGSAQAQATPLQKAKVAAGNLEEALGKGLSPVVDTVLTKFTNLARRVEPALNRVTKQISKTFNRKDLDLGDKVTISWAMVQRKLAPFGRQFMAALNNAHLGDKLSRAFEAAAPKIADAMAAAAPRAAGAFVHAFREAGPWGKIVTVAFLASKFGAFSGVGTWAASRFTTSLRRRMGSTMPGAGAAAGATYSGSFAASSASGVTAASRKGGRINRAMGRAGGLLGTAMGVAAAAEFGVQLAKGVQGALGDFGGGAGQKGGQADRLNLPGLPSHGFTLWGYIKKKIGDGVGKIVGRVEDATGGALPQGGAFGGSLMGARPAMKPFAAMGARFGLQVTSGRRPGAITSSGNQSWHSTGEAIDESGSARGMLSYFRYLKSHFGGRLSELIHTPGGVGIKDGRPHTYTGQVAADHYDHVHVAFDSGRRGIGDGLGKFTATSYGPPWGGIQGGGVTATGVNLKGGPRRYGIAVDPHVIPLGSRVKVSPNPFGYGGYFTAFDTGGAIKGHRIDFYDWRGRGAQNAWGVRSVRISTGGAGGGGGGGGRVPVARIRPTSGRAVNVGPNTSAGSGNIGPQGLGTGKRTDEQAAENRRQSGLAGPGDMLGYEGTLGQIGVEKATAESNDDLRGMIRALYEEAFAKKKRLRRVNALLRRRLKRATRRALNEEKAQLIADLKEIGALFKEYSADYQGGARTISAAEDLTAGVAPEGSHLNAGGTAVVTDAEAGPTPMDYANAQVAEASLTPDLNDDVTAAAAVLGIATGDLAAARASGDPRKVSEAIAAWSAANDAWKAATEAVTQGTETQQRLTEAVIALTAETKTQNDFAATVAGVATTQAIAALADVISGQIYGPTNNRRQTAGTGARVRIP